MQKFPVLFLMFLLCGCVDMGRVGLHPDVKTASIEGRKAAVEDCLLYEARKQNFVVEEDSPLSNDTDRFNLEDSSNTLVGWIEVSSSGKHTTDVDVFYAPNAPEVKKAVTTILSHCKASF